MNIIDPKIGEEYEGYVIEGPLGAGGMGKVYLGRHKTVGNLVAIKIVNLQGFSQNPGLQKRFLREAKMLYDLRGTPCIADILHVKYDPENPADSGIITEYIEGISFENYIGEGTPRDIFTRRQNFGVIIKIAGATAKVHEKGIIHRDLKPENTMIKETTKDGKVELHPELIDFGISKRAKKEGEEKLTTADNPLGSPLWAAPELFESSDKIDHTVDLFSLGLMIYQVLEDEGKHFYGDVSRFNKMSGYMRMHEAITFIKDKRRTRKLLKKLPSEVAEVVRKCIAYAPEKRMQTAEELVEACVKLDALLEKKEKEAIERGELPPILQKRQELVSQTALRNRAITVRGPTASKSAETVPDILADTSETTDENGKTEGIWSLQLILLSCLAAVIMGLALYIVKRESSVSVKPRKAKTETPKPPTKPPDSRLKKPATLPKPPAKGRRPSNAYVAHFYKAIDDKCRKTDPRREAFSMFPHYHLGCIRWHVQKLRNKNRKNFDKVALAVLIIDEARAHFCFPKRQYACGKGKEKKFSVKRVGLINECKKVAYKIGARKSIGRKKGSPEPKRLTALMNGLQAEKIRIWRILRQARRKQIQVTWIRSQPPDRMLCFKKQR